MNKNNEFIVTVTPKFDTQVVLTYTDTTIGVFHSFDVIGFNPNGDAIVLDDFVGLRTLSELMGTGEYRDYRYKSLETNKIIQLSPMPTASYFARFEYIGKEENKRKKKIFYIVQCALLENGETDFLLVDIFHNYESGPFLLKDFLNDNPDYGFVCFDRNINSGD